MDAPSPPHSPVSPNATLAALLKSADSNREVQPQSVVVYNSSVQSDKCPDSVSMAKRLLELEKRERQAEKLFRESEYLRWQAEELTRKARHPKDWEIDVISSKRIRYGVVEYFTHWTATWEREADLSPKCGDLIADYESAVQAGEDRDAVSSDA